MKIHYRTTTLGKSPFGAILIRLRTQRGLTQEGLAMATEGDRISSRSITNYERTVADASKWILPHRPGLRSLGNAMSLDSSERRALVDAWNETKTLKDARSHSESGLGFVTQGRESVVDRLLEVWDKAKTGTPQFVMLGGDSGIGKTAIARHVCDIVAASTEEVMISWGEAHSWATPVEPYLSVRHAMDRVLVPPASSFMLPGLYPNRPQITEAQIERVMKSIPHLGGALISESTIRELAEQSDRISNTSINSMLDIRSATESIGRWDEYFGLITYLVQSWPMVLVLEDMHWASKLSSSLLQHLAHHLSNRTDVPLMIVCTYRSNELLPIDDDTPHPFATFLQSASNLPTATNIHMQETLTPEHGMSFIGGIVGMMPMISRENENELKNWLYQRTSGQPMMTLETIRQLRESGGLVRVFRTPSWRFEPDKVPTELPTVISSLIAQRMKPIDRRCRFALEVAAAMGETILPEVMADVLNIDEESLLDMIDSLLVDRHEMLEPGSMVTVGHLTHPTYRYSHTSMRDYIYAETKSARRRRIHSDIADSISRLYTNTDSMAMGEITHHYMMAQDWHSAQMTAYRMAQLKTGRLDWELASVWFDQAEDLAVRAQDSQQLWRARAARLVVMRGLNQVDEALALGKRILQQAKLHNWPSTLALTNHHLGEIYYDLGQLDRAVEYIHMAHDNHQREHAYDLAAAAQAMLSHATYRQGKYDIAREHARRSLAYSRETHNSWVRSEAMLASANCDVDIGAYGDAIDSYKAAIELAAMSGKLANQFLPALNIGLCLTLSGDHTAAIEKLTDTIEQMEPHRVPRMVAWGKLYLGFALEESGQLEAAKEAFDASTQTRRHFDNLPVLYDSVAGNLSVAIRLNDKEAICEHLTEIVTHIDHAGLEGLEDSALVLLTVARAYRVLGDEDEYGRRLQQAHSLITKRASLIQDPAATTSYLTNVPTNADVLRRYNERRNA